jgi:hypothetical protein
MNDLRFLLRYSMRGMFFVDLMIMYRVYILVLQSTSSTKNIDRSSFDGHPRERGNLMACPALLTAK